MTEPSASSTGRRSRTIPREQWPVSLGFSSVWLMFLVFAAVSGIGTRLARGESGPALVIGVCTAAFCVIYLVAFIAPAPILRWNKLANTVLYTLVLAVLIAPLIALVGVEALNALPFFAAIWLFPHKPRVGLIATFIVAVVAVIAIAVLAESGEVGGFSAGIGMALVVLVVVRLTTERESSLREVSRRLELAEQRESLAHDVHDVVGHSLTAVHVKAQLLERLISTDPDRARREAREIVELTRGALGEVRATVDGLSEPDLPVVLAGARRAMADAGLRTDFPSPDAVAAVPEQAASLFAWVAREACTNVLRHAGATSVRVEVSRTRLAVVDNGVGMSHATGPRTRSGLGMRGVEHRVYAAGGTLTVRDEHPGHERPGTRVEVTI